MDASYQAKINCLEAILTLRTEELFQKLNLRLKPDGPEGYRGVCPIHGGRRQGALGITKYNDRVYWKCYTKNCHQVFKSSLIGFCRGVFSGLTGWQHTIPDRKVYPFGKTIDALCRFVGIKFKDIKPDCEAIQEIEKRKFAAQSKLFTPIADGHEVISKSTVRSLLRIPSAYFVGRGFDPIILDKYDIGDCVRRTEMSGRAVAPIYDQTGLNMVGCTGREVNGGEPKWKHSRSLLTSANLYNLWSAKLPIEQKRSVILVEGPADVWRLEMAGIHNAVALFGCTLHDRQQILLERTSATKIILLLDNDEVGRKACESICKQLCRSYTISVPAYSAKDIGDMSVEQIKKEIISCLT